MDDLISRQAAIDAAIDAVDDWDGGYNLTRANMIEAAMKEVPSASCKGCIHTRPGDETCVRCARYFVDKFKGEGEDD